MVKSIYWGLGVVLCAPSAFAQVSGGSFYCTSKTDLKPIYAYYTQTACTQAGFLWHVAIACAGKNGEAALMGATESCASNDVTLVCQPNGFWKSSSDGSVSQNIYQICNSISQKQSKASGAKAVPAASASPSAKLAYESTDEEAVKLSEAKIQASQDAETTYADVTADRQNAIGQSVATLDGQRIYQYTTKDDTGSLTTHYTTDSTSNQGATTLVRSNVAPSVGAVVENKDGSQATVTSTNLSNATLSKAEAKADQSVAKTELSTTKDANQLSKTEKQAIEKTSNGASIREENTEKKYGGMYGGAKVETTNTINTSVKTIGSMASTIATNVSSNQNATVTSNLTAQGTAATQDAINKSTAETLRNSAKMNMVLGLTTTGLAAVQAMRIASHADVSKITASESEARRQLASVTAKINADVSLTPAQKAEQLAIVQKQSNNASVNGRAEKEAQAAAATSQTIQTATTAAQAAMMIAQANSLQKQAAMIETATTADTVYAFNPSAVTAMPTPDLSAVTSDSGTVLSDDAVVAPGGSTDLQNPNISESGSDAPAAGVFTSASPGANSGSPLSGGSVGGTSAAAADTPKSEASALTKDNAGTYSAVDGSGSNFSRLASNLSAAVGVTPSLADLLKKFLPGAEDEVKKDFLALENDRQIASEQAAVLGRNVNIFQAVHLRYVKKAGEGAVAVVE